MRKKIFTLEEQKRNERIDFLIETAGGILLFGGLYIMTVLMFSL